MAADTTVAYRKRRNVELVMVLIAQVMALGAYTEIHLFRDGVMPASWPWVFGAWLAVGVVAHLIVRFTLPYADPTILPMVLLLNGIGLAMIHRLDLAVEPVSSDATTQFIWTIVALVGFAATILIVKTPERLHRFPYILFIVGVVLLLLPLVPGLGESNYGATIWINVAGYSFQPAEIAKIVLAIAFASYLADHRAVLSKGGRRFLRLDLPRARDLGPIMLMWGASLIVLVAESDLGTSLLFFGLFVMMLYVATEKPAWPIMGGLLFAGGGILAYQLFGHVRVRMSSWLDPFSDFEQNYQIIQGQFGMAWGGLFGRGWGLGTPSITPLAKSDFIAAAVGEELGAVGLMAIIVLYGLIVTRGLRAALTATEPFMKLLSAGLAFVLALQVFAIIGGVTRLLPLTGLTTPFMSQGGSSLLANWVVIALMLMMSHLARRPRLEVAEGPAVASLASDATQAIPVTRGPSSPKTPDDPISDVPVLAGSPIFQTDAQAPTQYVANPYAETQAVPTSQAPTEYVAAPEGWDEPPTSTPPSGSVTTPDEPTQSVALPPPAPHTSTPPVPPVAPEDPDAPNQAPHTGGTP